LSQSKAPATPSPLEKSVWEIGLVPQGGHQSVSKSVSILQLKKGPAQSAESAIYNRKQMYKSAESAQFHEQSFCFIDHQKEEKLTQQIMDGSLREREREREGEITPKCGGETATSVVQLFLLFLLETTSKEPSVL